MNGAPPPMLPKMLLLVNSDPASNGVGEIFLREIAQQWPAGQFVRYSIVPRNDGTADLWLGGSAYASKFAVSRLPLVSSLQCQAFRRRGCRATAQDIATREQEQGVAVRWVILNSPATIYIARQLLESTPIPLVATVWDDPLYFSRNLRLSGRATAQLLQDFGRVVRSCAGVTVASDGMRDEYRTRYGVDGTVLIHGLPERQWAATPAQSPNPDEYTIAFAGSLYAKREWNALVRTLDLHEWRLNGKPIVIRFFGRFPRTGARRPRQLRAEGVCSLDQTIRELNRCDVAYVPYWLDSSMAFATRTAFPSKLSASLAAGLPVLFHGPADSPAARMITRFGAGAVVSSRDHRDLWPAIRSVLADEGYRAECFRGRNRVLSEDLSASVMHGRFAQLVGRARCGG